MCTVSWRVQSGGYTLYSSRDELLTRPAAESPSWSHCTRVACIAPSDTLSGGTWISANNLGLTVCLLNGQNGPRGATSRGHLVRLLAPSVDIEHVSRTLYAANLSQFSPLVLIAIERTGAGRIFEWSRHKLLQRDVPPTGVLSSSSVDDEGVRAARTACFHNAHNLEAFHASHGGGAGPHSVCMHRPDAETVSLTRVHVAARGVAMTYWPGSPCERTGS